MWHLYLNEALSVTQAARRGLFQPFGIGWRRFILKPSILVEPFAGGGIISLTALFENLAERVVMVELDDEIAAVWQSVVNGDAEWLANRILAFHLTKETVIQEITKTSEDTKRKSISDNSQE